MKKRLIHIFQQIAKNDFIWSILKPFAKTFHGLYLKRLDLEYTQKILGFQNIFPDLTVRMGPFKSMKYPKFEAVCSTILPKLIGTYEMELANIIEDVKNKSYETIIDIGCAEGYYAVGFAMTTSNAQIIAYDIDPEARELCLEMAKLNLVEDKIIIKDGIDENLLIAEVQGKRALVLSDCEGFETELFTKKSIPALKNCDLLIETHDFYDINISKNLTELLAETHIVRSILSTDDIQKAKLYNAPFINKYNLQDKLMLFAEKRPNIMTWLYCESKKINAI